MMAKTYAKTIAVPRFDEKAAYDQDRPISSLIRTQLLHLTTAENLALSPRLRTGININTLHTERQAAEYIQKVTASLHAHGDAQARKAAAGRKTKRATKSRKKQAQKRGRSAASTRKPGAAVKKRKSRQ
jgi:hypothetical protein